MNSLRASNKVAVGLHLRIGELTSRFHRMRLRTKHFHVWSTIVKSGAPNIENEVKARRCERNALKQIRTCQARGGELAFTHWLCTSTSPFLAIWHRGADRFHCLRRRFRNLGLTLPQSGGGDGA